MEHTSQQFTSHEKASPWLKGEAANVVLPAYKKGRGAVTNQSGRFEALERSVFYDGWASDADGPRLKTEVTEEFPKTVISKNQSPDIPFDRSINPYRGCEHGCVYCFARPTHAYMGLSPGLDFESRLFAKPDAATLLEREIGKKSYKVAPMALAPIRTLISRLRKSEE